MSPWKTGPSKFGAILLPKTVGASHLLASASCVKDVDPDGSLTSPFLL